LYIVRRISWFWGFVYLLKFYYETDVSKLDQFPSSVEKVQERLFGWVQQKGLRDFNSFPQTQLSRCLSICSPKEENRYNFQTVIFFAEYYLI